MVQNFLRVVEDFDPNKNYEIKIRPQYARILASLKKGETVNPKEFIEKTLLNLPKEKGPTNQTAR